MSAKVSRNSATLSAATPRRPTEALTNLLALTGNPVLERVYAGLSGQIRRIRYMSEITDAQWKIAVEEHAAIIKALKARNGKALGRLLAAHLRTKRERVKSLLAA